MKQKLKNIITTVQFLLRDIKWITNSSKISLKYLAGINRAIKPAQVSILAKALALMGCIRPVVVCYIDFICGKKEYYIIDGQHLFNALMRLGWPIPYVVIDVKDKKDLVEKIALLNSSSKSWSMQDYVTAWASLKEDYVKLNRYFEIYDMEINNLASILSNSHISSNVIKKIKWGEFTIQDEEKNVDIINGLTDVLKIIPRMNRFENRYVCTEYTTFRRNSGCEYNHIKFIKNLEKNKAKFILATQEQHKLTDMFRNLTK